MNNHRAAIALLHHGAKRDVQDDYNQTPLFLGAREGNYEVTRLLLENLANRDVADHMDRLPRDIAADHKHDLVVGLLDNVSVKPLSSVASVQTSGVVLPPYVRQMVKKKRERKESPDAAAVVGGGSTQEQFQQLVTGALVSSGAVKKAKKKGRDSVVRSDRGKVKGDVLKRDCEGGKGVRTSLCNGRLSSLTEPTESQPTMVKESHSDSSSSSSVSVPGSGNRSAATRVPDRDFYDVNQNRTCGNASPSTVHPNVANAPIWQYDGMSPLDSTSPASPISTSPQGSPAFLGLGSSGRKPGTDKGLAPAVGSKRGHSLSPIHMQALHQRAQKRPFASAANDATCQTSDSVALTPFETIPPQGRSVESPMFHYPTPPSLHACDTPHQTYPALEHCLTPSPDTLVEPWSNSPPCSVPSDWSDPPTLARSSRSRAGTGRAAELEPLCSR